MYAETVGKIAYDRYCQYSNNKSLISGQPLPKWEDLRIDIQEAWIASASAIIDFCFEKGSK